MESIAASSSLIERRHRLRETTVLAVGGANVEHSYAIPGALQPNAKYSVPPQPRLAGGSSFNHACRLLAMGVDVHPILPLARADSSSEIVVAALDEASRTGHATYPSMNLHLEGANLTTPLTTIIRQGSARAVLNEFSPELMHRFFEHVETHLDAIETSRIDLVSIGHIHADRRPDSQSPGFSGAISERILTARELAGARKFVNFGNAQFRLGARRWDHLLSEHVDVFQLAIDEVRTFCRDADLADHSLEAILDWFRDRCTVVISLERFGAIGQMRGSDEPVAAWPYLLDQIVDTTGAGDAMGAGIVASMLADPFDAENESWDSRHARFGKALAFGRVCGAFACTNIGGAAGCPDLEALLEFETREKRHLRHEGLARSVSAHELFLIDRAFER